MKIFVVTHKKVEYPLPKGYEYIQVNAKKNGKIYDMTDFDYEDNISDKNPNYCELTATYSIWKNYNDEDIVGLAHYRRFFTTNRFSNSINSYLDEKRIIKYLKRYDFIATKLYKTKMTIKDHILINVREKDLELLSNIIKNNFSDYYDAYQKVLNGHESYLLNMFITNKKLWDEYYKWLFSIFDIMEKDVDMTGYTVQEQRLYGFLSERLFYVYVLKNNYKVKSYPVHTVGEPLSRIIWQKILKILKIKKD